MRRTLAAVALIGLIAAGCGDDDESSGGGKHNEDDVTFAQAMSAHHAQAVEMSDMAMQKATNPKVRELAARIRAAQGPEIEQMKGWLTSWGEDGGGMANMGDMGMFGMMTGAQMKELEAAPGTTFDKLFLEGMIRHHEGAVEMARKELADGEFAEAEQLAQRIVDTQQAEITEMRGLLGS